jgi:hypothetical protein
VLASLELSLEDFFADWDADVHGSKPNAAWHAVGPKKGGHL